jgi:hypothetical protein
VKKVYCDNKSVENCGECSKSSYGRDCRNNTLDCPDPPSNTPLKKSEFELELHRGLSMLCCASEPDDASYWNGYVRGIRKNYYGKNFGTEAEHELWLTLICETDNRRHSLGEGYRDGLAGTAKKYKKEEITTCHE